MDSFSYHSKFKLCEMTVAICISAKLAFKSALLWGWKISKKLYFISFKQKCRKDRISKTHFSMFMLQYLWNIEYFSSNHYFMNHFGF